MAFLSYSLICILFDGAELEAYIFCCKLWQVGKLILNWSFYCLVAQCTRLWRSRLRWRLQNGNALEEIGSIISPTTTFRSMDFSLATLRYAFVWNVTQGILIHAACGYSKIDLTLTKGRSSSSRSKVDISWLRPLASCLSSCWLSQLPSCQRCLLALSLRCCSCPCHCPCPQLLAAHPAWDAVLKLRTVLSPAFHLPSASQASSTSPLYCHTVKTQAPQFCCHTLTFNLTPPSPYSSPSVKLHHSYPCLISFWSTVSEVTRFCGSEWWSQEETSESFESQIKSTFRQTNPFVVQQCESTFGWINRVKIMILSGGKQGTTKWLSSEHTSYLRFVNFDTPPHYLGL